MYCKQCGKEVPVGQIKCVGCGTKIGKGRLFCEECGRYIPRGVLVCPHTDTPAPATNPAPVVRSASVAESKPIVEPKSVVESKPVVEPKSVVESKPVVEPISVAEPAPTVRVIPLAVSNPAVQPTQKEQPKTQPKFQPVVVESEAEEESLFSRIASTKPTGLFDEILHSGGAEPEDDELKEEDETLSSENEAEDSGPQPMWVQWGGVGAVFLLLLGLLLVQNRIVFVIALAGAFVAAQAGLKAEGWRQVCAKFAIAAAAISTGVYLYIGG